MEVRSLRRSLDSVSPSYGDERNPGCGWGCSPWGAANERPAPADHVEFVTVLRKFLQVYGARAANDRRRKLRNPLPEHARAQAVRRLEAPRVADVGEHR